MGHPWDGEQDPAPSPRTQHPPEEALSRRRGWTYNGGMTPQELSQKARQLVAEGAVLLDVRTPQEFQQGHPEAARNIPVQELPRRLSEVGPPGTRVVVYCAAGARSAQAVQLLRAGGYADVFDLKSVNYW